MKAASPTERGYSDGGGRTTVVLGLLAPPQIPDAIVDSVAAELPTALSEQISDRVDWDIRTLRDHRVPDVEEEEEGGDETIDAVSEWRRSEGWDTAVCLTDLPMLHGARAVVAESSPQRDVALVSLPALGATRRSHHAREAIVQVVDEVLANQLELVRSDSPRAIRRQAELVGPEETARPGEEDVPARLVARRRLGPLRLLAGMLRANRPFRVVLDLSYALAAALGTAAFALVTNAIWQLSEALPVGRLAVLSAMSVAVMTMWLIVVHGLWHRGSEQHERGVASLMNATTVITLAVGVLTLYVSLFVLTLATAGLIIEDGVFASTVGGPVGHGDYLTLAWFTASLATIGGTLGSGLETSLDVREAAYSYHRERRGGGDGGSR